MQIELTWEPYDAVAEVGAPEGTEAARAETEDLVVLVGSIPPLGFGKVAIAVKTPDTDYPQVGVFDETAGAFMDLDAVKQLAAEMMEGIPEDQMAEIVRQVREDAAAGNIEHRPVGPQAEAEAEDEDVAATG